jgi:hypothetical protein
MDELHTGRTFWKVRPGQLQVELRLRQSARDLARRLLSFEASLPFELYSADFFWGDRSGRGVRSGRREWCSNLQQMSSNCDFALIT